MLPEQDAPLVLVAHFEPVLQVVPLLQLLPLLLHPSLLMMLLISPDCPKQFEIFVQLLFDVGHVAACAVIGAPATVKMVAAAKTNTGNFLMVISSLYVTLLLHLCYKMYNNIQEMEFH